MGKGDRKTRRGKIWRGTFGRLRPSDSNKTSKPDVAGKPESES